MKILPDLPVETGSIGGIFYFMLENIFKIVYTVIRHYDT